jgi:hypothetical protein
MEYFMVLWINKQKQVWNFLPIILTLLFKILGPCNNFGFNTQSVAITNMVLFNTFLGCVEEGGICEEVWRDISDGGEGSLGVGWVRLRWCGCKRVRGRRGLAK